MKKELGLVALGLLLATVSVNAQNEDIEMTRLAPGVHQQLKDAGWSDAQIAKGIQELDDAYKTQYQASIKKEKIKSGLWGSAATFLGTSALWGAGGFIAYKSGLFSTHENSQDDMGGLNSTNSTLIVENGTTEGYTTTTGAPSTTESLTTLAPAILWDMANKAYNGTLAVVNFTVDNATYYGKEALEKMRTAQNVADEENVQLKSDLSTCQDKNPDLAACQDEKTEFLKALQQTTQDRDAYDAQLTQARQNVTSLGELLSEATNATANVKADLSVLRTQYDSLSSEYIKCDKELKSYKFNPWG